MTGDFKLSHRQVGSAQQTGGNACHDGRGNAKDARGANKIESERTASEKLGVGV